MLKKTELNYEGQLYSCELSSETSESLICKIYKHDFLNFEGKLTLKEIFSQIPAFDEYSMEEVFTILKDLEKDKFEMINSSNELKLKIMIKVLKKVKELYITLVPKSQSKEEIIQYLLSKANDNKKKIEALEKEFKDLHEKIKEIKEEKK